MVDKDLSMELVRVTEAAAISAFKWIGKKDKNSADDAAVKSMREFFNLVNIKGTVIIGEGEKDKAPMLYVDEEVGTGKGPEVDIAVDPLECTSNVANNEPDAMSCFAISPKGTILKMPGTYMNQICVGKKCAGKIDINAPVADNINAVAKALKKDVSQVVVVLLDRPRHEKLVSEIKDTGAKVKLIDNGTISAGISALLSDNVVDMMIGVGGSPEAVITAAAVKAIGGEIQGILAPHDKKSMKEAEKLGFTDLKKVYKTDDLISGNDCRFIATGVIDGAILKGVKVIENGIETQSLIMESKTKRVEYVSNKI